MTDFPEGESWEKVSKRADRARRAWLKAAGRPIWIGFAILTVLSLIAVVSACTRNADRSAYVEKNEQLLKRLKPYSGAKLVHKSSAPYYQPDEEASPRIIGYTTNLDYELPRDAVAREVADYHGRQLAGWKRREEVTPCVRIDKPAKPCPSVLLVFFTKGEASVSLNFDGFNGTRRKIYELVVDHRGSVQP